MIPKMHSGATPDAGALAARVAQEQPDYIDQAEAPYDRIRKAAAAMAAGSVTPDHLMGMPADLVTWLRVMPRSMLCRVACASDDAIDAHMHGRKTMRGVLTYDRDAVDQYRAANERARRDDELDEKLACVM
ncbi:hypothetical protein KKY_2662 [Pelagibacterium halotolerans B2]|uniref:Uncharacterized protein n=2 Tax=Pelagibacterium TaxID=1082930 RepID=G4RBJ4_PELHB|nr:hypothetical protein KKY_2662 [Pelagibacterium halotolerans B2]